MKRDYRRTLNRVALYSSLTAFTVLVILPTIYIISFTFTKWDEIYLEIFANDLIGNENWIQIQKVLIFSFKISIFTVLFDLIFGVPLAYTLSRKKFFGKELLENIITLPLVIPTSGFGFATLITWTTVAGLGGLLGLESGIVGLSLLIPIIRIPFLIFIVHVALTLPYIVLTLKAKMDEVDRVFAVSYTHLTLPTKA